MAVLDGDGAECTESTFLSTNKLNFWPCGNHKYIDVKHTDQMFPENHQCSTLSPKMSELTAKHSVFVTRATGTFMVAFRYLQYLIKVPEQFK